MWMQHYLNCDHVSMRGVNVWNHMNLNNDAVDIDGCRRVSISDCHFDTDDDGLTLKSTGASATENVVITNCSVSSFCNAIKSGTESIGGFRNVSISNCVITPSACRDKLLFDTARHGISGLALEMVDGGIMEGISVNNDRCRRNRSAAFYPAGQPRPYRRKRRAGAGMWYVTQCFDQQFHRLQYR